MRWSTLTVCFLLVVAASAAPCSSGWATPLSECAIFDIDEIGSERLETLTARTGLDAWIELDDELFACGSGSTLEALGRLATVKRRLGQLDPTALRLAHRLGRTEADSLGLRVIASGGLFALIEAPAAELERFDEPGRLLPFHSGLVLARQVANQPVRTRSAPGEGTVAKLVERVDAARWLDDVSELAGFNRHTLGLEIGLARQWLVRRFREIPGLRVRSRFFTMEGVEVANVVATLRGRVRPEDLFIVGAHYDSTSDSPEQAAPGAEDNASGCAGVLEVARIFAANPPEATILFICYAGEEQGLHGAVAHVAELVVRGEAQRVGSMLNLDMIGFTEDADLDCLVQSGEDFGFLVEALVDAARAHTGLRMVTSFALGGSDHVPYARSGIPAILSIENDWDAYPHYHRTTDTPDKLTPEMAAEILRMNVGALARMTGNSDVSGCLEIGEEPLESARVGWTQPGVPPQVVRTDRQGCYAVDPLERGRRFRLRIRSSTPAEGSPAVSGCVRLLGDPVDGRRLSLRQPGEPTQKSRSDELGCFEFEAAPGKAFTLIFKGPKVPASRE